MRPLQHLTDDDLTALIKIETEKLRVAKENKDEDAELTKIKSAIFAMALEVRTRINQKTSKDYSL